MSVEENDFEPESLGQFLQRIRIARGYEVSDVLEETRISGSNLKAIEEDDYSSLPADAFSRGFYTLYANMLELDPDDIIERFNEERGATPRKKIPASHSPQTQRAAKKVSSMAERSSVSPISTLGFITLLLIVIGLGFSWFFDVNPASFISEKLRGLQKTEQTELPSLENGTENEGTPVSQFRTGTAPVPTSLLGNVRINAMPHYTGNALS